MIPAYPQSTNYLQWWKLGCLIQQPNLTPGAPGYDPDTENALDFLAVAPS